jgi:hypothetical protein
VHGGHGSNTATLALAGASSDAGSIGVDSGGVLALGGVLTVTGSLTIGGTIKGGTLSGPGKIAAERGTLEGVRIAAGTTVSAGFFDLTVRDVVVDGRLIGDGGFFGGPALTFGRPGIDRMTNIFGFTKIRLADGGANTLKLTDANFGDFSRITIVGGNDGNTVDGSSLRQSDGFSGVDAIDVRAGTGVDVAKGGAGSDRFFAGGHTRMTGGAANDQFLFVAPGSNAVTDFKGDKLVVGNAGFHLGLAGATSTPKPLPANLFHASGTGAFTSAEQRFAYNTGNGQLRFDADGNGGGSSPQLVATLTGHPTLPAADLFFVK